MLILHPKYQKYLDQWDSNLDPLMYTCLHFSGQPNIIYYAADVFKAVGFCTEWSSTLATVGLGTMKVISTAISLSFVDRLGRKKCLVIGVTVMGLAVFILGLFAITDGSEASKHTCQEVLISANISENSTIRPLDIKE